MELPSLEYIAGFFDGEGTITFQKGATPTPIIQAAQSDRSILELIGEALRQHSILTKIYRRAPRRGRLAYVLTIVTRPAQERFLLLVGPHLIVKQAAAKIIQGWFAEHRPGTHGDRELGQRLLKDMQALYSAGNPLTSVEVTPCQAVAV